MRHVVIIQKHSSSNSHNFRLAQNFLLYLGAEKTIIKELKKRKKEKHNYNVTENKKNVIP